jgi:diguanylate cyclase (GGDEF)-like protein
MGKNPLNQNLDCKVILKADLFSTLLEGEQEFVVSKSGLFQLRKGSLLFSPGSKADHFYLLLEGVVRIFKPRPDNNGEDEVARFTAGDTIGDFDFARNADYDAYAEAVEDCMLVMFPGYGLTLTDLAQEAPHTVSKIYLSSIIMMTSRIKSTRKIIMENMSWVQELHRKAYEDPGTGLWKQTFLTDEINRLLEEPMALIMLKPDRFKILVDSRGHGAGDEAMILVAHILRNITRRQGRGWPLRFKSNETGILMSKCAAEQAEQFAADISAALAGLPEIPARAGIPAFPFTGTVAWGVWPGDNSAWDGLFQGTYDLLLSACKEGGGKIVHYRKEGAHE